MEISDWDKAELWKHPKGENGEIFLDPELPLPPTIIGKERRYLSWLVAVKKLLDLHPNHVHIYTLFRHAQSLDLSSPRGLHDFSSEFVGETPLTASKAPNVAPSTTSQALLTKTRDWNHCKFICAVLNYQVVCWRKQVVDNKKSRLPRRKWCWTQPYDEDDQEEYDTESAGGDRPKQILFLIQSDEPPLDARTRGLRDTDQGGPRNKHNKKKANHGSAQQDNDDRGGKNNAEPGLR